MSASARITEEGEGECRLPPESKAGEKKNNKCSLIHNHHLPLLHNNTFLNRQTLTLKQVNKIVGPKYNKPKQNHKPKPK